MAVTFWHANYWHANYWHADYWSEEVTGAGSLGDLWHDNYWHANYWASGYWASAAAGAIFQQNAGVRTLTEFSPTLVSGPEIQTDTPTRTLSGLTVSVNNSVTLVPDTQTRLLGSFSPTIDTGGYVEGDVSFTVFASSAFGFTDGVEVTLGTRTLTAPTHGVEESGGEVITVQQTPARTLTQFNTSVSNNVSLDLATPTRTLTGYDTDAGFGIVVRASAGTRALAGSQASVTGTPNVNDIIVGNRPNRILSALVTDISAISVLTKLPDTVTQAPGIINNDAVEYPSFYEICQRTGMRVKRGTLIQDGYGHWVRPESADMRHPQEFVRSVRESTKKGSPNQETAQDRFIGSDVAEVTADSL